MVEVDRYGGGAVMVWEFISWRSKLDIHIVNGNLNSQKYRDEIINPIVIPERQCYGPDFIFMKDNAPAHCTRDTKMVLQNATITNLDWLPYSPDLNPIEQAWDELGCRVRARDPQPQSLPEIW